LTMRLPQTVGERRQAAQFIRATLDAEKLRNDWLILQLEREGFRIKPACLCEAMALRSMSPLAAEFLARAVRICERYLQQWTSAPPAGN
jgi:hypothetical protein